MTPTNLLAALHAGPVADANPAAVATLRAEGIVVSQSDGLHRLSSSLGFGPATLSWRCGRPVEYVATTASTNQLAKDRARHWAGPPTPGPLVVADHQTAGRGRRGRSWQSAPGDNLLFSLVLRPSVDPAHAARCVLQWAAAMAEVLDLQVKWPNDLVTAEGHKVAGILAELELQSSGASPGIRHLVLGVGINANQLDFPADLPAATSLRLIRGAHIDRAAMLGELVAAIHHVDVAATHPLNQWRARSHTLGKRVRIGEVEGIADAIRDDGALLVGGHPVLTGDVELVAD